MHPTCSSPLALLAVGPSAQALSAHLQRHLPASVRILATADGLRAQTMGRVGLLILLIHPATLQDIAALTPLADALWQDGFGVPTLCIHARTTGDAELMFEHFGAWHLLRPHIDTTVEAPSTTPEQLSTWLAQALGVMAQSLGDEAQIGVDVQDITHLLRGSGPALWLSTEASGPDRAAQVVQQLGQQLALCAAQPQHLHRAIVWVQASAASLKLHETRTVVKGLQERMAPEANMLLSAPYDENLGEVMRVWMLAPKSPPCLEQSKRVTR